MDITKEIKKCLVEKNLTIKALATGTNQKQQNMTNKLRRGDFRVSELEAIASVLGADLKIQFIDRQTGQPLA